MAEKVSGSEPQGTQGQPPGRRKSLHSLTPASQVRSEIDEAVTPGAQGSRDRRSRSRSPMREAANAAAPTSIPLHSKLKAIADEALHKILEPSLAKHMQKQMLKLASQIESLQKVGQRWKQLQDDVEVLKAGDRPQSCKAYSAGFESPFLDCVSVGEPLTWTFDTVADLSIRKAKEKLHFQHMAWQKTMDLRMAQAQRESLRMTTRQNSFVAACKAFQPGAQDAWDELDLEIDPGSRPARTNNAQIEEKPWPYM